MNLPKQEGWYSYEVKSVCVMVIVARRRAVRSWWHWYEEETEGLPPLPLPLLSGDGCAAAVASWYDCVW